MKIAALTVLASLLVFSSVGLASNKNRGEIKYRGVALEAELTTGPVKELNATIRIRSLNDGTLRWVVERWNECKVYPCNPAKLMKAAIVKPTIVGTDSRASDGCITIRLNSRMTLGQCNGMPEPGATMPHPYKLTIEEKGAAAKTFNLWMTSGVRGIK